MDRYNKVRKIGEGAFGLAYLARTKDSARQVVLKEINMNRMTPKERVESRKEVAVLSQLKHSNIVCYLESFEDSGTLVIVMDYCDGGDLYTRINGQRGAQFPEEQILDWFVQMSLAIKHIHDRKILHRDIKSQNIFLTKHGIIKLGDFGIAKVLNSTVELARTCIGTPYYLSPEICEAKPYNNKSDIWSLGCVLYELTNLKHAFEAGSMNMLVQKIVRGNYPPPSSKYSLDLRSLIGELFRRNPRERPSINTVLKKPLLQAKIRKFLTELEIAEEFSHTVMHGVKLQKALPGAPAPMQPRPLPPKPAPVRKPPTPSPSPSAMVKQSPYNPAAIYGPSVARKSKDGNANRKSQESRKSAGSVSRASGGSANSRPPSAGAGTPDLVKRRQELMEKEKERREEIKKKQDADIVKQHRDLLERQKARMQKLREEGWRNILGGGDEVPILVAPKRDDLKPTPVQVGGVNAVAVREVGNFDRHFAQLQRIDDQRAANIVPVANQNQPGKAVFNPVSAAKQGQIAGNAGAAAADRAKLQQDFLLGRQAAAVNRMKAQGGFIANNISPRVPPVAAIGPQGDRPFSAPAKNEDKKKNDEEESIMARLQRIRQQNLAVGVNHGDQQRKFSIDDTSDAELRKQKIEAIKAQAADLKEKRIKEELEKKRREGYELEQKRLQLLAAARPYSAPSERHDMDKGAIGLTVAMQVIAGNSPRAEVEKEDISKRKGDILKRINAKERPKWSGAEQQAVLGSLDLEITSQEPTAITPIASKVSPPRNKWAAPRDTMVNVLKNANITETSDGPGDGSLESSKTISGEVVAVVEVDEGGTTEGTSEIANTDHPIEEKDGYAAEIQGSVRVSCDDETVQHSTDGKRSESRSSLVGDLHKTRGVPFGLAQGLSTGHFDVSDVKLLRTCSEPDLTQFCRPAATSGNSSSGNVKACQSTSSVMSDDKDLDEILTADDEALCDKEDAVFDEDTTMNADELGAELSTVVDSDDDDDELNGTQVTNSDEQEGSKSVDDDDDDDDEDCDELEDLATYRANLVDLLTNKNEGSSDEGEALSASVKTKKKISKKSKTTKKGKKKRVKEPAPEAMGPWCDESAEKIQILKDTIKSLLVPQQRVTAVFGAVKSELSTVSEASVEKSASQTGKSIKAKASDNDLTIVSALPDQTIAWDSDDGSDDYFEDTSDIFSRLEEIRARLEQELGLETCRSAYLAVQSLADNEDDTSDDGIKEITKILGADKVNPYYQMILQLVMADGAYTEGND